MKIGGGGFGEIYKALDHSTDEVKHGLLKQSLDTWPLFELAKEPWIFTAILGLLVKHIMWGVEYRVPSHWQRQVCKTLAFL